MSEVSAEQLAQIKEAFALFDKNGDGHITVQELGSVFKELGTELDEQHLQAMIKLNDLDGNGKIDFNEFLKLVTGASGLLSA